MIGVGHGVHVFMCVHATVGSACGVDLENVTCKKVAASSTSVIINRSHTHAIARRDLFRTLAAASRPVPAVLRVQYRRAEDAHPLSDSTYSINMNTSVLWIEQSHPGIGYYDALLQPLGRHGLNVTEWRPHRHGVAFMDALKGHADVR